MIIAPQLVFSHGEKLIFLKERPAGRVLFALPAHNHTVNPEGDPLKLGSSGPAPYAFLTISPPDFISHEYRADFYREYFGDETVFPGESYVQQWGEFEMHEMGPVRFALGDPAAPQGFPDRAAWDRELLVHGGGTFQKLTHGCIRMEETHLKKLTFQLITFFRKGYPLNTLLKTP